MPMITMKNFGEVLALREYTLPTELIKITHYSTTFELYVIRELTRDILDEEER